MRKILFMFDFDGTLAPIVNDPEKAALPAGVKDWIKELSESDNCKVAIVTGRSLKDIRKRVGLKNVIYSSNHGMDIYRRGRIILQRGNIYKKPFKNLEKELRKELSEPPNVYIENKGLSIAVHLRRVKKQYHNGVKKSVKAVVEPWLERYKLQLSRGKMLLEVRPLSWNKGKAVLWIWKRCAPKYFPIYVGDDVTDEDAFLALKPYGLTIRIGRNKKTYAECRSVSIDLIIKSFAPDVINN
jgi:trehalose-phosphatase